MTNLTHDQQTVANWIANAGRAVKSTEIEFLAPPRVKDPGSWARRMVRKLEELGEIEKDDVDNRSGGVWWVSARLGDDELVEEAAAKIAHATGQDPEAVAAQIQSAINPPEPLSADELMSVEDRAKVQTRNLSPEEIEKRDRKTKESRQVRRARQRKMAKAMFNPGPHNGSNFANPHNLHHANPH